MQTQHQVLYDQQLLPVRECSSLVFSGVFDANISLKATGRLTNRCSLVVSLGSTITLCISAVKQTTSSGLLVFNTSLSIPYFVFGVDYAFYTLISVAIRIFDVIFIAQANFTFVLRRSRKNNIFRFKNITVFFMTNFVVFFVF